jgi:hypothetical protein
MFQIHEGQCGMCVHFGEQHPSDEQLVHIHMQHEAPEEFVDDCGHPKHAALHLKVTAISCCDGFDPVSED